MKIPFWSLYLGLQSIWFLHFGNNQFYPYYFQTAVNLIHIVNLLMENIYMTNILRSWHIKAHVANKILIKKFKLTFKNAT